MWHRLVGDLTTIWENLKKNRKNWKKLAKKEEIEPDFVGDDLIWSSWDWVALERFLDVTFTESKRESRQIIKPSILHHLQSGNQLTTELC